MAFLVEFLPRWFLVKILTSDTDRGSFTPEVSIVCATSSPHAVRNRGGVNVRCGHSPRPSSFTALQLRAHMSRRGTSLTVEGELTLQAFALDADGDDFAGQDLTKENALGQGVLNVALDGATQRASTEHRVEAAVG